MNENWYQDRNIKWMKITKIWAKQVPIYLVNTNLICLSCSHHFVLISGTIKNELFCLCYWGFHRRNLAKLSYLPTPPLGQDMTQGQFLSLTGLNSEFSFS